MPRILKTPQPKGPWLKKGDLDHNLAVQIALPELLSGRMINIFFANEALKEYQKMMGGGLVINVQMNLQLFQRFNEFYVANKRAPTAIPLDSYPFRVFVPMIVDTSSRLGSGMVPRGTKAVAFFSVPKILTIGGQDV